MSYLACYTFIQIFMNKLKANQTLSDFQSNRASSYVIGHHKDAGIFVSSKWVARETSVTAERRPRALDPV